MPYSFVHLLIYNGYNRYPSGFIFYQGILHFQTGKALNFLFVIPNSVNLSMSHPIIFSSLTIYIPNLNYVSIILIMVFLEVFDVRPNQPAKYRCPQYRIYFLTC